jgi:hypothetical protein
MSTSLPNNNDIDYYLPQSPQTITEHNSIITVITDKNNLIDKYKHLLEEQSTKHKEQIALLTNDLSSKSKELLSLKAKLTSIESNDIIELVNYYESEIEQIITRANSAIHQYQSKLNTSLETLPLKDKTKKVIELLMTENEELRSSNATLQKLKRMNQAYKYLTKQFDNKIEANKKNMKLFQKEQISQLNQLVIENKRLKDENDEDKKLIANLANKVEYLKTKYEIQNNKAINIEQSSSKLNTSNKNIIITNSNNVTTNNNNINNSNSLYMLNPIPNSNTNTNTKPNSSSLNVQTSLNSISSNTKQIMFDYNDNQSIIVFDNYKLDKYLNSCKVIITDKFTKMNEHIHNMNIKVNKDNSIYKKIFIKTISELQNELHSLSKEIHIILKKANSAFISNNLSKNILQDTYNECINSFKKNKMYILTEEVFLFIKKYLNSLN